MFKCIFSVYNYTGAFKKEILLLKLWAMLDTTVECVLNKGDDDLSEW